MFKLQQIVTQNRRGRMYLFFVLALLVASFSSYFLARGSARAASPPLKFLTNIAIPGAPPVNWFRDAAVTSEGNYYLSDATNFQVDQVDIHTHTFTRGIGTGLFNGPANSANFDFSLVAPEGVVAFGGKIWATNVKVDSNGVGDSQVLVFDQQSGKQLATIDTKGQHRSDEMTVMPNLGLLVVTNPDETFNTPPGIPFLSFIRMSDYTLVTQLPFHNASPGLSGLQAPTWIGGNIVDVELPSPAGNINGGEVDTVIVPPGTLKPFVPFGPAGHHPLPAGVNCQPAGMSLNFHSGLAAVGCGYFDDAGGGSQAIYNVRTNKFVAIIPGVQGVDIVATTPSGLFLFPSYISNEMYVTDAKGNIIQTIATSDLAHTVTFDPDTGEVFVPTGGGQVAVYST
jgi:hypothetical protein